MAHRWPYMAHRWPRECSQLIGHCRKWRPLRNLLDYHSFSHYCVWAWYRNVPVTLITEEIAGAWHLLTWSGRRQLNGTLGALTSVVTEIIHDCCPFPYYPVPLQAKHFWNIFHEITPRTIMPTMSSWNALCDQELGHLSPAWIVLYNLICILCSLNFSYM